MNITDIDDKIINRAKEENVLWTQIASTYEQSFFTSMKQLNILYPDTIIRVSEVIPQIIHYIQVILDKGFAYVTFDGSVYFDTQSYKSAGYRYQGGEEEPSSFKKSSLDFALWKGRDSSDVGFEAEFNGKRCYGRPGWHIECSTMIQETLGDHLDVHYGGIDLKFPHHYNEEAQSNAYHHPKYLESLWCDEFCHTGHLCIEGCKMSKSLKNFTTISDILKVVSPNVLRWLFMKYKWNEPMNYSEGTLKEAKYIDQQIKNLFQVVEKYPFDLKKIKYSETNILSSLENHLSTYSFDEFTHELMTNIKKIHVELSDCPNGSLTELKVYQIKMLLMMLGFDYTSSNNNVVTDQWMKIIVDQRNLLRELTRKESISKKDVFEVLDQQRNGLKQLGVTLQDTKEQSLWFME
jgi:cysteinyl-tRNA synthetase